VLELLDDELRLMESSCVILVGHPDCLDLPLLLAHLLDRVIKQAHYYSAHLSLLLREVKLNERFGH